MYLYATWCVWNMPVLFFLTISSQGNLSQKWVRKSWNELSKGLQEFFFKKNHSRSHENLINRNIVALCIIWLVVKMVFPVISKINMGLVGKMVFPVISKINIGLVVKMLFPVISKINMGLVVKMVFPVISKINMEPQTMEVWFRWLSFSIWWFSGSTLVFRGVDIPYMFNLEDHCAHRFYMDSTARWCFTLACKMGRFILLLMEEILHHLGCIKPWNNGINYQPQLVQDFWTINSMTIYAIYLSKNASLKVPEVLSRTWTTTERPGSLFSAGQFQKATWKRCWGFMGKLCFCFVGKVELV